MVMPSDVPMIPTDFARAVHRSLLLYCGIDGARAFWERYPLTVRGIQLDPIALVAFLEDNANRCPMSWYSELMNGLGPFLHAREIDIAVFARSLLVHANRGSFVSAKSILSLASPFLSLLFRMGDPHRLFVHMGRFTSRTFLPELIFEELAWYAPASTDRRAILAVGFAALWQGLVPPWDAPHFTALLLREMPRSLGVAPYAAVETLADARPLASIVDPMRVEQSGDLWLLEGKPVGRTISFDAFCDRLGVSTRRLGTPSREVVVLERACSAPGVGMLRVGSCYGAPLYLFELRWRLERQGVHSALRHIVDEALHGHEAADDMRARALQRAYARSELPVRRAIYVASDTTFYFDDLCVARGVPALILRNCLREHLAKGRTEFAFREFKRQRELVSHPKSTGFEVRLRRLRERLDAVGAPVRIRSTGRGRFALDVYAQVEFEERDDVA